MPPLEAAVLPRPMPTSPVAVEARPAPALPPRLLGPKDAGAYLGVSAWTARQLVKRRKLRRVKLPGIVSWLIDRADLDALIERAKAR